MIQTIIHRLLKRRHFWRYATFSEVAELYASRTMRMFALRMVATFTSVYLYQEGYGLLFLAFFWAAFYGIKVLFAWPSAQIIARFGPKHGTLASNIISAGAMFLLPLVPVAGIWALGAWCVLQAFSGCLNDLSYLVDFSKVKNMQHAGKELGYMNIFEKIANGISPVVGGVLAMFFGPWIIMVLSATLFILAAWPLFRTGEPTRTHQKLDFKGFPWRSTWRSLGAETAVGYDVFVSGSAWTLFMTVIIFAGDGHEVYAKIGALTSATLIVALGASYAFGKMIDQRKGGELLRATVILNSLTHIFRAFVGSPAGVAASNFVNEVATTGYAMAFTRGMFDTADITGKRIVYLFLIEVVANAGATIGALLFAAFVAVLTGAVAFQAFFIVSAFVTLLIATPRFVLYRK